MKEIVINLTRQCTAKCGHCCFSCSMKTKDKVSNKKLDTIIDSICNGNSIKKVNFTGGEVFLEKDKLFNYIELLSKNGIVSTVVSNGFWGNDKEKVRKYFDFFKENKMVSLTISWDDYHSEFVSDKSISNILEISKEYMMYVKVSINAVEHHERLYSALKKIDDKLLTGIKIQYFPASPTGEYALNNYRIDNYINLDDAKKFCCNAIMPTIHHNDKLYPCCSVPVFDSMLDLELPDNVDSIVKVVKGNMLVNLIHKKGLSWFVDRIDNSKLQTSYTTPCELCRDLFSSEERIEYFSRDIKEYYGIQ